MSELILYPILPAAVLGILNWTYWKRKGYTSKGNLFLGILLFYTGFYFILKTFY